MSVNGADNTIDLLSAQKSKSPKRKQDDGSELAVNAAVLNFSDVLTRGIGEQFAKLGSSAGANVSDIKPTQAEPRERTEIVPRPRPQDDEPRRERAERPERDDRPARAASNQADSAAQAAAAKAARTQSQTGQANAAKSQQAQTAQTQVQTQAQTQQADLRAAANAQTQDAAAQNEAAKNTQKLGAKVTIEQAPVSSQPSSSLTARSAIGLETAQSGRSDGSANAQGEVSGKEASRFNVFSRLQAESGQTGKNNANGGNAGNAGGNNANAGNGQSTAQPGTPPAPAIVANTPAANRSPVPGFQSSSGPGLKGGLLQSGSAQPLSTGSPDALGGQTSLGQSSQTQQARAAQTTNPQQAARSPVPPGATGEQLSVNIQRAAANGQDRITIQLKPQDLGRVEVKIEVSHDGRLQAVISADKPETLDLLRQDSRHLLQSLNDAGLKSSEDSLSFNLRGQQGNEQNPNGRQADSGRSGSGFADEADGLFPADSPFGPLDTGPNDGRLDVSV